MSTPYEVASEHVRRIKLLGGHHHPCDCSLCVAATATLAASLSYHNQEVAEARLAQAETILRNLDATFEGRDADGAPGADGSYWLGHSQALAIWYWLHPDHRTDGDISL